jgi:hypothetical protein
MPDIDAMFAVIDGNDQTIARATNVLRTAFGPEARHSGPNPGQIRRYLQTVLEHMANALGEHDDEFGMGIVLWFEDRSIVGFIGNGNLQGFSPRGPMDIRFDSPEDRGSDSVRIGIAQIPPSALLVLGSAEVERYIRPDDTRRTMRSTTLEGVAAHLATSAARRGGRVASVVVAQIGPPMPFGPRPANVRSARVRRAIMGLRIAFRVILVVAVLFVLIEILSRVIPSPNGTSSSRGLQARQVDRTSMLLTWQADRRASGYIVRVGERSLRTSTPRIELTGVLTAGQPTVWQVAASHRNGTRTSLGRSTLILKPVPVRQWRFAAVRQSVDGAILTLRNAQSKAVRVTIRQLGQHKRLEIPGNNTLKVTIPPQSMRQPGQTLRIHALGPILAQLVLREASITRVSYGIPGVPDRQQSAVPRTSS